MTVADPPGKDKALKSATQQAITRDDKAGLIIKNQLIKV